MIIKAPTTMPFWSLSWSTPIQQPAPPIYEPRPLITQGPTPFTNAQD